MGWSEQQNGYNNGSSPHPNSPAMTDRWAGQNRLSAERDAARNAASVIPSWTPPSAVASNPYGEVAGSYTGVRMDLNGFQFLMFFLGIPVGFVVGVIPFFIRGLGFYSWYPKSVGFQTGIIGAFVFWALSLLTRRGGRYFFGAVTVLVFACLLTRVMPTPFLALYKSLLNIR